MNSDFWKAHTGDIIDVLVLSLAAATTSAMSLGLNARAVAILTLAGTIMKIVESKLVPVQIKAAAYVAFHSQKKSQLVQGDKQ